MKLINATGKHPSVPECPRCKGKALKPEPRYGHGGKMLTGFWRCDSCEKVYIEEQPLSPPL